MKILHIMRELNDHVALRAIAEAKNRGEGEVGVLLLHDSVLSAPPRGVKAYACKDDVEVRGIGAQCPTLDYDAIIQLIFHYDSVITW